MQPSKSIKTLTDIVSIASKLSPDRIAYRFMASDLSYANLDHLTSQLSSILIELGVKKGDRVGIFLPRCLEIPIAIYGILKAGGVFVPLDPNMPSDRLERIILDCQLKTIIGNKLTKSKFDRLPKAVLNALSTVGYNQLPNEEIKTNVCWDSVNNHEIASTTVISDPDDLAYIMYTSGTTGTPKGIMHTHSSGLSYARLSQKQYEVNEADIIANHAQLHFDISTFGYLTAPYCGATTIILSDAHVKFPLSLLKLIKKEQISIWYSVPIALMQLSHAHLNEDYQIESVRWVLFGGEVFNTKQLVQLMQQWPQAQFSNVYGPAEVNQCTYYTVPNDIDVNASVPLGYIWDETEMLILDEEDNHKPKGEIGRLLIHSSTMMNGYWNNPKKTQDSFFTYNSKKYYRTGDLVSINPKGLLAFHGRSDRQAKTRGYRVELNTIESILNSNPMVKNSAVFTYDHSDLGKLIGASIVLEDEALLSSRDIQSFIAGKLPKYCIPEKIEFVNAIMRTKAGKIDYKTLENQFTLNNAELN